MTIAGYLTWFDEVVAPTEPMIRLVEDRFLESKLTERSFTIGQLIAHLPRSLRFNTKVLQAKEDLPTMREILLSNRRHPTSTVEESVDLLNKSILLFKEAVNELDDDQFQKKIISTPQMGNVVVWRFCVFVIEHQIHHMMELHLSLKVLGLPVNTKTLYAGV